LLDSKIFGDLTIPSNDFLTRMFLSLKGEYDLKSVGIKDDESSSSSTMTNNQKVIACSAVGDACDQKEQCNKMIEIFQKLAETSSSMEDENDDKGVFNDPVLLNHTIFSNRSNELSRKVETQEKKIFNTNESRLPFDRTILMVENFGSTVTRINFDTFSFCLLTKPFNEISKSHYVIAVVIHWQAFKNWNRNLRLLGQKVETVFFHWIV
jgi:hypothetical protein